MGHNHKGECNTMFKRFVCTAVVVSLIVFVVLVARANAQEGINAGEGMPPVAEQTAPATSDTTQTAASETSPEEEAPATTSTEKPAPAPTVDEKPAPGSSVNEPFYVKIVNGEPRAVDKHGHILPKPHRAHRARGGGIPKTIWDYRNGRTKDQKIQWSAISTAQATANRAEAKADNLNTRVTALEKAAKGIPWWGWLALVLGAIGTGLGIWRLAGGGFRRVYY